MSVSVYVLYWVVNMLIARLCSLCLCQCHTPHEHMHSAHTHTLTSKWKRWLLRWQRTLHMNLFQFVATLHTILEYLLGLFTMLLYIGLYIIKVRYNHGILSNLLLLRDAVCMCVNVCSSSSSRSVKEKLKRDEIATNKNVYKCVCTMYMYTVCVCVCATILNK